MAQTKKNEKRIARLTPLENRCWVFAFCFYLTKGMTNLHADHLAWRDLQMEFPRLRKYHGCLP